MLHFQAPFPSFESTIVAKFTILQTFGLRRGIQSLNTPRTWLLARKNRCLQPQRVMNCAVEQVPEWL